MSDDPRPDRSDSEHQVTSTDEPTDEPVKGPSLTLLYGLIALALAAAIALAALIVRPFYLRH